ncbi:MAG TPA: hypothetical protein VJJ79_03450 [Candidatus Nanoarchaeia archaeon]|nr:hypothetical protein [Candidatus Nanoarchaeia archaeon]
MEKKVYVKLSMGYLKGKGEIFLDIFVKDAENQKRIGTYSGKLTPRKDFPHPNPEWKVAWFLEDILKSRPFNLKKTDQYAIVDYEASVNIADFPKELQGDIMKFVHVFETIKKKGMRNILA